MANEAMRHPNGGDNMRKALNCRRCVFNSPSFKYFTVAWVAKPINMGGYCANIDHLHTSSAFARFYVIDAPRTGKLQLDL